MIKKLRKEITDDLKNRIKDIGLSEQDEQLVIQFLTAPDQMAERLEDQVEHLLAELNFDKETAAKILTRLKAAPQSTAQVLEELKSVEESFEGLSLSRIDFNWEKSTYSNSGIPILPEDAGWAPDRRSFVAYSLADIKDTVESGKLKIKAQFFNTKSADRIQVRTRNVSVFFRDKLTGKIGQSESDQSALGTVKPTTIYFSDTGYSVFRGKYSLVPLTLENIKFPNLGVGVYDINWQWEYRELAPNSNENETVWEEDWKRFSTTKHRVFIVLDTPKFPWTPYKCPDYESGAPFASPLDADALTHACTWAQGSTTVEEAARNIAEKLFASDLFVYNPNSAYYQAIKGVPGPSYGRKRVNTTKELIHNFHFQKVLERLNGGLGLGKKVNCLDCALIVSTLANILGCELKVGKLQGTSLTDATDPEMIPANRFEINQIRAIGHKTAAETMVGLKSGHQHFFSFHAVAWQMGEDEYGGLIGSFDFEEITIFDACLQFEDQSDCSFTSAVGLRLGAINEPNTYRSLLATESPEGRPKCIPQDVTVIEIQLK